MLAGIIAEIQHDTVRAIGTTKIKTFTRTLGLIQWPRIIIVIWVVHVLIQQGLAHKCITDDMALDISLAIPTKL